MAALLALAMLAAGALGIGAVPPGPEQAVASPPAGFTTVTVLDGLDDGVGGKPTAFAWAPDGRIFVARKLGIVEVWTRGDAGWERHTFLDLRNEVNGIQGRGLLGIALAPDFTTSRRLFLMFTKELVPEQPDSEAPAGGDIISLRVRADNPLLPEPGSRVTLLTGFASTSRLHSVGGLVFGPDGHLYASLGDGQGQGVLQGAALGALDLDRLEGKILRLNPTTGHGVPGNPYFNPAAPGSTRSKVWARGFRNPYRFSIDTDGTLYAGDVGWATWEDVHRFPAEYANADRDRSGGWPCYEGGWSNGTGRPLPQPDYQNNPVSQPYCRTQYTPAEGGTGAGSSPPLWSYRHDAPGGENGSAVTAGPVYRGTTYPSSYRGKLFIADYARDRFQVVDPATGVATDFGTPGDWGNPVDIRVVPSGNLAYIAIGPGQLREIVWVGANEVPTAVATADATSSASAPFTVRFSAAQSSDPDPGDVLTYSWDFADGSSRSTAKSPTHTFSEPGSYRVTLTVSDGHPGGVATAELWIDVVNTPPIVGFAAPTAALRYRVGDTIGISVVALDGQDGVLAGASVRTQVVLVHLGHEHYEAEFDGLSGTFFVDDHESDDTYYRLDTTATDSAGRSTRTSIDVLPRKVPVTLQANSGIGGFSVDGEQRSAPFTWNAIVGGRHELIAPVDATVGGVGLAFDEWAVSEGATRDSGTLLEWTVPDRSATVTARFASTRSGLGVGDASVVEGDDGRRAAVVPITLAHPAAGTVTAQYRTVAATAGSGTDFVPVSGAVTFAPGVQERTVEVPIIGDDAAEVDERVALEVVAASGAPIVDDRGDVVIIDDDPSGDGLGVGVGDVQLREPDSDGVGAQFVVSLSRPSPGNVSVVWATFDGSATAPLDYVSRSGVLTFPAGVTSRVVPVEVRGDGAFEPGETFHLALAFPVGATVTRAVGTARVVNEDLGPRLSVSDQEIVEGDTGQRNAAFSIVLSTPATEPVAVRFAITHGTTNGADLLLKSGQVTIPAGINFVSVQPTVYGDTLNEPVERFRVTISEPVNAKVRRGVGIGTIRNDDPNGVPGLRMAVGDGMVAEGDAGVRMARFTIFLSRDSAVPVQVDYSTVAGTAGRGDFRALSGRVTIPPGRNFAFVNVAVEGDAVPEADEVFSLVLANANVRVTDRTAVMTIRNDDLD